MNTKMEGKEKKKGGGGGEEERKEKKARKKKEKESEKEIEKEKVWEIGAPIDCRHIVHVDSELTWENIDKPKTQLEPVKTMKTLSETNTFESRGKEIVGFVSKELGKGSYGEVYLVYHYPSHLWMALKVLNFPVSSSSSSFSSFSSFSSSSSSLIS